VARKLPIQPVVCTSCRWHFQDSPELSFLGLPRFTCPSCQEKFLYPMTGGRRKAYWVIAVVFGLLLIGIAATGRIPLPGILPVGAFIGLVQDRDARKRVAAVQASGQAPVGAFGP
jgi:predicted RNA-binding Zn-ribbon protein involved in translation (DUF1610 family)